MHPGVLLFSLVEGDVPLPGLPAGPVPQERPLRRLLRPCVVHHRLEAAPGFHVGVTGS